jgi:hypothetical protein
MADLGIDNNNQIIEDKPNHIEAVTRSLPSLRLAASRYLHLSVKIDWDLIAELSEKPALVTPVRDFFMAYTGQSLINHTQFTALVDQIITASRADLTLIDLYIRSQCKQVAAEA